MQPLSSLTVHFGFPDISWSCWEASVPMRSGPSGWVRAGRRDHVNALRNEKGGRHLWPCLAFDLCSRYGVTDSMGFLYLAYAGLLRCVKRNFSFAPCAVYIGAPLCCKQPRRQENRYLLHRLSIWLERARDCAGLVCVFWKEPKCFNRRPAFKRKLGLCLG